MTVLSCITRPFKEKATGVDGFKYCVGDEVIVAFDGPEGADKIMVPVGVLYLYDNMDGFFTVGIEGIEENNLPAKAEVFSGNIHDPKKTKMNSNFIPLEEVVHPYTLPSISATLEAE